ncbi:MAG: hypothetical protein MUF21_00715 [Gemmatimonadaceae bacterium]|nr:hypothetical protein [Gemmatimonadaceae bacterium]
MTDYFVVRSPDPGTLQVRLSRLELPCLIFDHAVVPPPRADVEPWWAVVAADLADVALPRSGSPRARTLVSPLPLPSGVQVERYERDVVATLLLTAPLVLQVYADETMSDWSLSLWRAGADRIDLVGGDVADAIDAAAADAMARAAPVLGVDLDALRDALADRTQGPGALCALAAVPYLPTLDRNLATPAASLLIEHGCAVLSSALES